MISIGRWSPKNHVSKSIHIIWSGHSLYLFKQSFYLIDNRTLTSVLPLVHHPSYAKTRMRKFGSSPTEGIAFPQSVGSVTSGCSARPARLSFHVPVMKSCQDPIRPYHFPMATTRGICTRAPGREHPALCSLVQ